MNKSWPVASHRGFRRLSCLVAERGLARVCCFEKVIDATIISIGSSGILDLVFVKKGRN